jgi:phage shock protein A
LAEAKALYREVVAGFTAHYGAQHVQTLESKMNLAVLLQNEGTAEAVAEAKALYREVVAGETEHYGTQHVQTLKSKMNLAVLLKNEGTAEAVAEAKALYREVVALVRRFKTLKPSHKGAPY